MLSSYFIVRILDALQVLVVPAVHNLAVPNQAVHRPAVVTSEEGTDLSWGSTNIAGGAEQVSRRHLRGVTFI